MEEISFYYHDQPFHKNLNITGIYGIFCIASNKWYIGQAVKLGQRLRDHRGKLKSHKHPNSHLNNAVKLYGIDSFLYFILETCTREKLQERETFYIQYYNTLNDDYGYNQELVDNCVVYSEQALKNRRDAMENRVNGYKHLAPLIRSQHPEKSVAQLSRDFNVCRKSIRSILKNKFYYDPDYTPSTKKYPELIRERTIQSIKDLMFKGITRDEIRKTVKTSSKMIDSVIPDNGQLFHTTLTLNTETGIFYNSIKEAASSTGYVKYCALRDWLIYNPNRNKSPFVLLEVKQPLKSKE